MNQPENKICQNCKSNFLIEPEDFQFYERIQVPPPTFCPDCRMKRRMLFRNEFNMHKCKCVMCGKETISHYSSNIKFPVYCNECWWSDKWDPLSYGRDYDVSKNFFEQWKSLSDVVPRPNLEAYQNENSPYSDFTWFSKNVYLSPSTISSDNVAYSKSTWNCRDTFDSMVTTNCENVYQVLDSERCVNCQFISDCKDCLDSSFLFDCRSCTHCFMSSNLRGKKFVFRNQQLTQKEYEEKVNSAQNGYLNQKKLFAEYIDLRKNALHKYANTVKCVNSTGHNISDCKNSKYCFNSRNCEDAKYGIQMQGAKTVQDMYGVGDKESTLLYDGANVGYLDSNVYFSANTFENCLRVEYCDYCRVSQDLFGCIGIRKKQYCILNKQYDKETYTKLIPKIKKDMAENPHRSSEGLVYRYGEFFPIEFSPFAYNESVAQSYYPTQKEAALKSGYKWIEPETREYQATKKTEEIPNSIHETAEDITSEVLGCEHNQKCGHNCTLAFKITSQELRFYQKNGIPIPRICSGCRNGERWNLQNPVKLWIRNCMCNYKNHSNTIKHLHHPEGQCPNTFETSYSSDRPEVVYCEECYNAEII